jgi:hypothetical protein
MSERADEQEGRIAADWAAGIARGSLLRALLVGVEFTKRAVPGAPQRHRPIGDLDVASY